MTNETKYPPQKWIKRIRKTHRLSQEDFGLQIGGANPITVLFWETGRSIPCKKYRHGIARRFLLLEQQVDELIEAGDFDD